MQSGVAALGCAQMESSRDLLDRKGRLLAEPLRQRELDGVTFGPVLQIADGE